LTKILKFSYTQRKKRKKRKKKENKNKKEKEKNSSPRPMACNARKTSLKEKKYYTQVASVS